MADDPAAKSARRNITAVTAAKTGKSYLNVIAVIVKKTGNTLTLKPRHTVQ